MIRRRQLLAGVSALAIAASPAWARGHGAARPYTAVAPPSGFGYTTSWTVGRLPSGQIVHNFNPTSLIPTINTQYYLDPVNGSDSNSGLSSSAAFKTLGHALAQGSAGVTIGIQLVLSANYVALGSAGWSNYQPTANVVITNRTGYRFICTQTGASTPTSWTQNGTYSNVYQVATHFYSVIDIASASQPSLVIPAGQKCTVNGQYILGDGATVHTVTHCPPMYQVYTLQTSVAAVAANPGSYYYDGTNTYVSTPTGRAADANVIGSVSVNNGRAGSQNNQFTYVEGLDFVGGSACFIAYNVSTVTGQTFVFNNCSFQGSSNNNNCLSIQSYCTVYVYQCLGASGQADTFNYHSYEADGVTPNTSPNFHEFECVAIYAGFNTAAASNNCFTGHDYCWGTRVLCLAINSTSGPIIDDNYCKTWNVGCFIGPSTDNVSSYDVNAAALINSQMWFSDSVFAAAISPEYQVYVDSTASAQMYIASNMNFPTYVPSGRAPLTFAA